MHKKYKSYYLYGVYKHPFLPFGDISTLAYLPSVPAENNLELHSELFGMIENYNINIFCLENGD